MRAPRNEKIKCPCCWEEFNPSKEALWIAAHPELKDDYFPRKPGEQKRFLPERFTLKWRAIDERGEICRRDFACPECHMEIPESYFDCEPMYVSVVGTTGAGKTFFLAAQHYRLQQDPFAHDYGEEGIFFDSALYASHSEKLEEHASALFRSLAPLDAFVTLGADDLGNHEEQIRTPDRTFWIALPFTYVLRVNEAKYALCLYDRKGSLFTEGIGNADHIFTESLLNSHMLFFLYDPTQNANCFRDYTEKYGRKIYLESGKFDEEAFIGMEKVILEHDIKKSSRHVLGKVVDYIRRHAKPESGLIKGDKYTGHICVVVTKCDAWEKCLSENTQKYLEAPPSHPDDIIEVSKDVESWIRKHDSAFVSAVKDFAEHYTYIPVSAAGRQAEKNELGEQGYKIGYEPLHPRWVEVPFFHALYETVIKKQKENKSGV